jgi:putative two-component system response regulator
MSKMKRVLVVDDEPNNLQLIKQILGDYYQLIFATSGEKALVAAAKHLPDLILLDVMMPEMDGYEVCERLKANPATQDIPVIFVTAMGALEDEARGFDVGGVDYIQKPVHTPIILRRMETHLSLVRMQQLENSQKAAVYMLGEAGHFNDSDTGDHIWRIAAYSRALAQAVGWPEHMLEHIELAAPMHDTGKIGTPHTILKAPRPLTAEEWTIMKLHTQIGYDILKKSDTPMFKMAADIALCHHEKWDGSGYPGGLKGDAIPEAARIVALVDVFDALSTKRPYKEAWTIEDTVAEIHRNSGSHFEPRLVERFKHILPTILNLKEIWKQREANLNMATEITPQ